jgi:hypothetical protein
MNTLTEIQVKKLLESRHKTEDGKPIDQVWFTRKEVLKILDKVQKELQNTASNNIRSES